LLLSGPPIETRPINQSIDHQHTQVMVVHPVEERQVMRGDILQMLASKEDKASMMMLPSCSAGPTASSSTTAAPGTGVSLRQKGQNASGRTWKVRPQKRASTLVTSKVNGRVKDWADRLAERECRRETIRVQKEMEDAKRQEAIDKKQRKLENEKRRQENELKNLERSGAIQALNHDRVGRTLKAMNKEQLRHIKKSRVNTKTGIVEFVPAYAK
jgi:predicted RNase H-like nuclease (RuvC/YqgF family)